MMNKSTGSRYILIFLVSIFFLTGTVLPYGLGTRPELENDESACELAPAGWSSARPNFQSFTNRVGVAPFSSLIGVIIIKHHTFMPEMRQAVHENR